MSARCHSRRNSCGCPESFRGDTLQVPSMYSALKHQGRPLYEYARKGITIEREARPITVYELLFIRYEGKSWSWKFTARKALISALSLMISVRNSVAVLT